MSLVATAPPILAFVGTLIVLAGTGFVLLGVLLRIQKRSGRETADAIGNSAVGIGAALAFVGLARELTTAEEVALVVAGLVLIVGLVVAFRWAAPEVSVDAPKPDT